MKTSSTREQNIKQYFDKAAEIEYSLLPKAKTKHCSGIVNLAT
ncbi:hypothetical protein EDC91_15811 [Shewanella fodinae]|uniref:Uncharacterized protein n=1 Tax=Shewanella fodinae TaxID=552357 RepID=A0A4R2FC04_9GAMM|nr:hypothetical protein EDC91_15811 [Shewanella fodinae]